MTSKMKLKELLTYEFETLREFNLSFCRLTELSNEQLKAEVFECKNSELNNLAGYTYDMVYSVKNNGYMPDNLDFVPNAVTQRKTLHNFKVKKPNYFLNIVAKKWNVDTAFPNRLLKQYMESGVI